MSKRSSFRVPDHFLRPSILLKVSISIILQDKSRSNGKLENWILKDFFKIEKMSKRSSYRFSDHFLRLSHDARANQEGGCKHPPCPPLLLSMHKSRGSKIYLSMHKSMVYVLIYFGKLYLYTLTCKKLISEKRFKFQFSLSFQGLTNFRSSKGCGCHF